jgi:hypothetical protein
MLICFTGTLFKGEYWNLLQECLRETGPTILQKTCVPSEIRLPLPQYEQDGSVFLSKYLLLLSVFLEKNPILETPLSLKKSLKKFLLIYYTPFFRFCKAFFDIFIKF